MGSNLDCEGLGRFAAAPQSSWIVRARKFHVQAKYPATTCEIRNTALQLMKHEPLSSWAQGGGKRRVSVMRFL